MKPMSPMSPMSRGYTLIELLAVLALMVQPLAEMSHRREQERELRRALWEIRDAIDAYKRASDTGLVPHEAGQPAYPPTLQALVRGVTNGKEGAQPLYFLRRLWLQRSGSDLQLTLLETNDKLTIQNWYSGSAYRTDSIELGNGKRLLESQADTLVSAMAAFYAPTAGQTSLPVDYQTALNSVIAANWK
jgi:prepilin-type N-terminal cleavage/methylation domain-containing protein